MASAALSAVATGIVWLTIILLNSFFSSAQLLIMAIPKVHTMIRSLKGHVARAKQCVFVRESTEEEQAQNMFKETLDYAKEMQQAAVKVLASFLTFIVFGAPPQCTLMTVSGYCGCRADGANLACGSSGVSLAQLACSPVGPRTQRKDAIWTDLGSSDSDSKATLNVPRTGIQLGLSSVTVYLF